MAKDIPYWPLFKAKKESVFATEIRRRRITDALGTEIDASVRGGTLVLRV